MQRPNKNTLDEIKGSLEKIDEIISRNKKTLSAAEDLINHIPEGTMKQQAKIQLSELKKNHDENHQTLLELQINTSLLRSSAISGQNADIENVNSMTQATKNLLESLNSDNKRLNNLMKGLMPQLPPMPVSGNQTVWLGEELRTANQANTTKALPKKPSKALPTPKASIKNQQNQIQPRTYERITVPIYDKLSTEAKLACLEKTLKAADDKNHPCVNNTIELKRIMANNASNAEQVAEAIRALKRSVVDSTKITKAEKDVILAQTNNLLTSIYKPGSSLNQDTVELDKLIINITSKNHMKAFNRNIESLQGVEEYINTFEKTINRTNYSDITTVLSARVLEAKKELLGSGNMDKVLSILKGEDDKKNQFIKSAKKNRASFYLSDRFLSWNAKDKNKQLLENLKENISEVNNDFKKRNQEGIPKTTEQHTSRK